MKQISKTENVAFYFLIIIAIALQIQISLFANGDYLGLRINMADFILPFAGMYILLSLIKKNSNWPQWLNKYIPHLLFLLLGILTISLINGYIYIGSLSRWALINKYFGFIILISYFFFAGWIATNFNQIKTLDTFAKIFCATFLITLSLSIIDTIQQHFSGLSLWIGDFTWDGFMANRNAYMLCAVLVMIFITTYSLYNKAILPHWYMSALWIIIPTFAIYNGSRTGWIFGSLVLILYLLKSPLKFMKNIAPLIAAGIIISSLIFNNISQGKIKENRQYKHMISIIKNDGPEYFGDQKRYIALEDGLELYQQSNPLTGAGLGAYKPFQIKKRGEYIDVIDFSALWLLTETGIMGISSFSAFFLIALITLFKKGYKQQSPYHMSMLFFLIIIIAMSFLHELLYTRFLWFALGLGMAHPYNTILHSKRKQASEASCAECSKLPEHSETERQRTYAKKANWYKKTI